MSTAVIVNKMETTDVLCITEHEGFDAVCLNVWVLQATCYQYKQQYEHNCSDKEVSSVIVTYHAV